MSETKSIPINRYSDNLVVVNKRTAPAGHEGRIDFYIGRGSALGNEFTHIPEGTQAKYVVPSREEAIRKNMLSLIDKIEARDKTLLNELKKLYTLSQNRGVNLVCYCAPKACHGDNIKTLINRAELINGELKFHGLQELKTGLMSALIENQIESKRLGVDDQQNGEIIRRPTADELRAKNKVLISKRDSAVIEDRSTEIGLAVIKVAELKKHRFKIPLFVGTGTECKAWVAATPEVRKEIEEQSLKRLNEKLELDKHALDISKPGEQADLFAGNRYSLPRKDGVNVSSIEEEKHSMNTSQGMSM